MEFRCVSCRGIYEGESFDVVHREINNKENSGRLSWKNLERVTYNFKTIR